MHVARELRGILAVAGGVDRRSAQGGQCRPPGVGTGGLLSGAQGGSYRRLDGLPAENMAALAAEYSTIVARGVTVA
ncbi:MAG: hypothetical protein JHC79_22150, partial [Williamsia sp.]|nr:hypothetical protein [Williamsia sp.]